MTSLVARALAHTGLLFAALLVTHSLWAAEHADYGRAYLAEGDSVAAAEHYSAQLQGNPFDPVALNNLAVAKAAAGDYQTARGLLERAAKLAPQRKDIATNLAHLQDWMDHERDGIAPASVNALLQRAAAEPIPPAPPPLWPRRAARASASAVRGG